MLKILFTTGGSEALLLQWVAMDPGDEIIIPEPFYANTMVFCCIWS
jgi:aspartate aminotransferase